MEWRRCRSFSLSPSLRVLLDSPFKWANLEYGHASFRALYDSMKSSQGVSYAVVKLFSDCISDTLFCSASAK
ncbi:hypothetical protein TB1_015264 [Malus domestica]